MDPLVALERRETPGPQGPLVWGSKDPRERPALQDSSDTPDFRVPLVPLDTQDSLGPLGGQVRGALREKSVPREGLDSLGLQEPLDQLDSEEKEAEMGPRGPRV